MTAANYSCPSCNGTLRRTTDADDRSRAYTCRSCGMDVHELVAEHADDLEAVANSGGPLAPAAREALSNGGL